MWLYSFSLSLEEIFTKLTLEYSAVIVFPDLSAFPWTLILSPSLIDKIPVTTKFPISPFDFYNLRDSILSGVPEFRETPKSYSSGVLPLKLIE